MKIGLAASNRGYYSSSGPVYVNTAFVNESIGNDGTAQLNNPSFAFMKLLMQQWQILQISLEFLTSTISVAI
jgi:hypothetical protein